MMPMLNFLMYQGGQPAKELNLRNCYMLGSDGNAMRSQISFSDEESMLLCQKRETGTAAVAMQTQLGDLGELTLQTCLLPDRDQPYVFNVELARHRLMTLYAKLEDWQMFDLEESHPVRRRAELARQKFVEALCLQREEPTAADRLAREALHHALDGSEELALGHSELLLARRKSNGTLPRTPVGCGADLMQDSDRLRACLLASFDFLALPMSWKQLAPEEGTYNWDNADRWIQWASRHSLPVTAGPVISFDPFNLPDWLYIWEHDFDTVRDLIYEHVERVVNRYRNVVTTWNVVSGLHVNSHFTFNFEQLMDLTRMTAMLVKKIQPAAKVVVELRQPFGEYYGANQRSIPPMMYADLVVQSAMQFDAFGLQLAMGQAQPGQYVRDLMQISAVIDQFAAFSKPLHITFAAPSEPITDMMIASDIGQTIDTDSGFWRRPWNEQVQAHWLEAVFQIALSKPQVEAVAWGELVDHPGTQLPLSGLIGEDHQPKQAFRRLVNFRRSLGSGSGSRRATTQPQAGFDSDKESGK